MGAVGLRDAVQVGAGCEDERQPALGQNLDHRRDRLVVQVNVEDKPLIFSLDTGAKDTDLNEGFAKALPELVKAGQKEKE